MEKKKNYLKSSLKERGWTPTLIEKILGRPDHVQKRRYGGEYHIFDAERVEQAEASLEFSSYQEKTRQRRQKMSDLMQQRAASRRKELLTYIANISIQLPIYSSKKELFYAACEHYNRLWTNREKFEKKARVTDDETFLSRIAMNMLRHTCDQYEDELEKIFGKVGKVEAYEVLKTRINIAIKNQYPFLKIEEN